MTDTTTEKNTSAAADDETSEMRFGAGETAWLAVVTVLALLGVALGVIALIVAKDNTGGGTAAPAAGGGGAATEATVSASEFAFDPADVQLVAGQEVSVALENGGAVEHNWTVLSEEITSEAEFSEDLVVAQVGNTAAGESNDASFTLEPGEYQVICTITGHFDAGMQGTVSAS